MTRKDDGFWFQKPSSATFDILERYALEHPELKSGFSRSTGGVDVDLVVAVFANDLRDAVPAIKRSYRDRADVRELIADAIDQADLGFSMKLIRLEHGIHTYSLTYTDGESLEFCDEDTDEYNAQDRLYAHVRERKRQRQADAVLAALSRNSERKDG